MPFLPYRLRWLAAALALGTSLAACDDDPAKPATKDASSASDAADGAITPDSSEPGSDATSGPDSEVKPAVLINRSLRWDSDLRGTAGTSPDDVWVVGKGGLILRWNGRTLTPVASPSTADLYAVSALSPTDAVAVGDGVLLQWNGGEWLDRTPDAKPSLRAVHGLAGSATLAVGLTGQIWRRGPDGSWSADSAPTAFDLFAVRVTGPGQAWALGSQGQALRYAGGSWSVTAVPKASGALRTIAAAPSGKLFAAGDDGFLAATQNASWTATLANDPQNRTLRALFARTDGDAWALGDAGALLHWTQGKWQLEQIAGTYFKTRSFHAAWGMDAPEAPFALAVGDGGAGLRLQANEWQDFRIEVGAALNQVVAQPDGGLLACGEAGVLLRASGANAPFADLAAPVTAADLLDCAAAADDVIAVGHSAPDPEGLQALTPVVAFKAAGGWQVAGATQLGSGIGAAATGAARMGSGWLVVGEGGGAVLRDAAGTFSPELTANQIPLSSVAVDADGAAYAVGLAGTVLRRAPGGGWSREQLPGGDATDLFRVVAWGSGEAMAVGDAGTIWLRSSAGDWQKAWESPATALYGATRRSDGTLIAVGWAGALIMGQPGALQRIETAQPSVLRGVAVVPSGTVAVGMKGAVYRFAESLP